MNPIDKAVAEKKAHMSDDDFSYKKLAAKYNVSRTTLSRRCRGVQGSVEAREIKKQKLSPQQELELMEYINILTDRGLPPTRLMVQNFAAQVAKEHVGAGWVTRFIHRNNDHLTSRWTTGMDAVRHKADSKAKYKLYFNLLADKITEYSVLPSDTYNMDKKGFMIGVIGRSKRIFSRAKWESKAVREALQDGSREWITLLAAVCADGSYLSPGIIFESKNSAIQSSWVDAIQVGKHDVFVSSSASGWTNNDIGLAWLEQVFNRQTKEKARRGWRLLIVDGHGSHITIDFLEFCHEQRILVAIYPPHSTHTLQPLNVVLFKPLSAAYKHQLTQHLHLTQGLIPIKKGDFFLLFWRAWNSSFTKQLILKSFKATGIMPLDPKVILKRFHPKTPEQPSNPKSSPTLTETNWRKMRSIVEAAIKEGAEKQGKKITLSLHHLQVQNDLLQAENKQLQQAITLKKKQNKKSKVLNLQQREEYHGGAVFWSPSKLREARFRNRVKARKEEQEKLQKAERRHMKEQAALLKKIEQEEARVKRERKKKDREKERERKAAERAELQRKKQQEKEAATTQKALQLSQKGKRAALQSIKPKAKRRRSAQPAEGGAGGGDPAPSPPPKLNSRGRKINLPKKFK